MNKIITYELNSDRKLSLTWWRLVDVDLVRRSIIVCLVLGSVLTLVNQPEWVLGNKELQLLPMILVFVTPFLVVSVAQLLGKRKAIFNSSKAGEYLRQEGVFVTAISHGILISSLKLGLVFGSVNLLVTVIDTSLSFGSFSSISLVPLIQAYALPILFGVLSQTISYRRFLKKLHNKGELA